MIASYLVCIRNVFATINSKHVQKMKHLDCLNFLSKSVNCCYCYMYLVYNIKYKPIVIFVYTVVTTKYFVIQFILYLQKKLTFYYLWILTKCEEVISA